MKFNHSKLLGRIKECGFTQESLAKAIKINKGTMTAKLNGQSHFTSSEIVSVCNTLDIPYKEISQYFFAL